MRAVRLVSWSVIVLAAALAACGPSGDGGGDGGGDDDGSPPGTCTAGEGGCDGLTHYTCGDDGRSHVDAEDCPDACDPTLGCVACAPGQRRCDGSVSMVCADGSWGYGRDCADWNDTCGSDGYCEDVCAEAERSSSNVGCEYWPVPLANTTELPVDVFDFRVVVANPSPEDAHVKVTRGGATVHETTIAPGALEAIVLPWVNGQSFAIPEGSWNSLMVGDGAYRLVSDTPVIATQYNPFEYSVNGTFSYTNDASLLLPAHALTGRYVGASYDPLSRRTGSTGPFGDDYSSIRYPGYLAIVGTTPTPTTVTLTASGEIQSDAGGRIARTPRGGTLTFTINRGEVAHVTVAPPPECVDGRPGFHHDAQCDSTPFGQECDVFDTCAEDGNDLTGTRIAASAPIEVFGGHTCAYVPYHSQACDHLEEQLPPVETWGSDYVGAPLGDGGINGKNLIRVIAAFDDTAVQVSTQAGPFASRVLAAGEFLELEVSEAFRVESTRAVSVAQYMVGQEESGAQRGDPSLTMLIPAEQWRSDYDFIMPTSYNAGTNGQNHLMIIRPPGLAIAVDGAPVAASFQAIGAREIGVALLDGGTHHIEAAAPFGVIAYGLGSYTSYATPAGLDLEPITVIGKGTPGLTVPAAAVPSAAAVPAAAR
ncbi:MAG TPA: IgGFc-binding protein [Kofleriaceae bacterium]|nr:IgGFc-binding protein [Kofleriaceae bacterium]